MEDNYLEPAEIPDPEVCLHTYAFALVHEPCEDSEACPACQEVDMNEPQYSIYYCPFCETFAIMENASLIKPDETVDWATELIYSDFTKCVYDIPNQMAYEMVEGYDPVKALQDEIIKNLKKITEDND